VIAGTVEPAPAPVCGPPDREGSRGGQGVAAVVHRGAGEPGGVRGTQGGAPVRQFDVGRVRALYPALADGFAYLDGAAGTQVPQTVIDAIAGAYRGGIGNVGGAFPASERSDAIVAGGRRAVADLVGGVPEGVVLGPNMTTLTYRLANALAAG